MGLLTQDALFALLDAGCSGCGGKKLRFQTYVDGRQRLLGGEPDGGIVWAYKGETFIDGVFEVCCAACAQVLFTADVCPRCNAPGGLATALQRENDLPIPKECPSCGAEELSCLAMLPAHVLYEGKRADKARTHTELYDEGFRGYQLHCRFCGFTDENTSSCPLCQAPGPLRPRPS